MHHDATQQQSPDDQQRARELSLTHARPPLEIPGYEIRRFLGHGAYGEVWVGVDRTTNRQVAIKFYLHRGGVDWSLLSREVEKLVFLSADRYVVQLLDVGWDAEPPYFVMEFIEHGSLNDRLQAQGTLPVAEAVKFFRGIAIGLAHAHGKGVLHCDLKPANILLDADLHPRLADFGQSRLSHEQSPALGTLFYMAPEQADLDAVPDARWDVYAIGSILYCMLTGEPPHRTAASCQELEACDDLPKRLACYRRILDNAPPLRAHRRLPGVDRALAEIIELCLAIDPQRRFGNIQSVLDALEERDVARARRPLQILGVAVPLLLLLIMGLFGWRGYEQAVANTELLAQQRARENNRFAAELAAERVAGEIQRYFEIAREEADQPEFRQLLYNVLEAASLADLNNPALNPEAAAARRVAFDQDSQRRLLNDYVESRLRGFRERIRLQRTAPNFASMFVTDKFGTMVAAAYDEDVSSLSIGRNWAHRSYFHGGPIDLPPLDRPRPDVTHIEETHLSAVFKSSTTRRQKVAVSTPVYREEMDGDVFVGVLVLTINLSDLEFFRETPGHDLQRFTVLVDGRRGRDGQTTDDTGRILQHPLLTRTYNTQRSIPDELLEYRVDAGTLRQLLGNHGAGDYRDPFSRFPSGQDFDRTWIASAAPVLIASAENSLGRDTGLIVLVQESSSVVVDPVRRLASRLAREGLSALAVVATVSIALWYFVSKFLAPVAARQQA